MGDTSPVRDISCIIDNIKSNVNQDLTIYYETAALTSSKFPVLRSGLEAENFVCGDVNVEDFQSVLLAAGVNKGDTFYDLGCGSGNCLIACCLSSSADRFSKVVGIELMKSKLIECSFVISHLKALQLPMVQNCILETIDCNFLISDWTDGDIVYACATCYTNTLLSQLFEMFQKLRKGSRVILLDKTIPDGLCIGEGKCFELMNQMKCRTTWGFGVAYVYQVQ